MILKLQLTVLSIGALLIVGLITFELPDWQILGINIPVLGAALIFAIRILYWAGSISQVPSRILQRWQNRRNTRAREAFDHGIALFLSGQFKQAREALCTMSDHPVYARSANLLAANCALNEGRFRTAHAALEQARRAGAEIFTTDLLEAQVYDKEGQRQQARVCLQRLRQAHPDHSKVTVLCEKYENTANSYAADKG